MKRLIFDKLITWKTKKNRKPMLLNGARQVGKTWLMKELGKLYSNTVYLYFAGNNIVQNIFRDSDVRRIISEIEFEFKTKITDDTLLIFDEIQECPIALSSLKCFYENAPEYNIICAGSLMGLCIHQGTNFPVGKTDMLNVYPMTFKEFLIAMGYENYADAISSLRFDLTAQVKDRIISLLKQYYIVGGMPEAVQSYTDNRDINEVKDIQSLILEAYDRDFSKHAQIQDINKIRTVWNTIPAMLARDSKKFLYKNLGTGARAKDYEYALTWLSDYGLINPVHRTTSPKIPLKFYTDPKAFKVYINDVGLLSNMYRISSQHITDRNSIFTEFKGALTEEFTAQELKALGNTDYSYYTNDSNRCEVDFLYQNESNIIPLEIKAEINLQAKSLRSYMEKFTPKYAVRASLADYKINENGIIDIPLYYLSEIEKIKI